MNIKVIISNLLSIMLCLLLFGCTSVNIPNKTKADFVDIFHDGHSIINYKLQDNITTGLEILFKPAEKDSILKRNNEELFIHLVLIDRRNIRISLMNQYGDTLIREFKGRFDVNTFRLKTKWYLVGNPLVWGLGTQDNIIAMDSTGELLLYHNQGGMGFVTLVPIMGASSGTIVHRFEEIK